MKREFIIDSVKDVGYIKEYLGREINRRQDEEEDRLPLYVTVDVE